MRALIEQVLSASYVSIVEHSGDELMSERRFTWIGHYSE